MQDFITLYNNHNSIAQISSITGESPYKITRFLKSNGVKVSRSRCRFNINSDFFSNIDTEGKAYFLGLIGADGSISYHNNGKRVFPIELLTSDIDILNRLSFLISGDYNLVKTYYREGRNPTSKISFSDETFINILESNGIKRNKSLDYEFPEIDHSLCLIL